MLRLILIGLALIFGSLRADGFINEQKVSKNDVHRFNVLNESNWEKFEDIWNDEFSSRVYAFPSQISLTSFGYSPDMNPSKWPTTFRSCRGDRQSPINIRDRDLTLVRGIRSKLRWEHCSKKPLTLKLTNSGHTVQLEGTWPYGETPVLRGGPLKTDYVFWQMHFHWGTKDTRGSDHLINGRKFPLEIHVVHFNPKYGTPDKASMKSDGIAVVGYLYEMTHDERKNLALEMVVRALHRVHEHGQSTTIRPVEFSEVLPAIPREYVTYRGSFTAPPCNEVVTWIVAGNNMKVTKKQLKSFRRLELFNGMHGDNFRPPQPLNDRKLYYVN